jgi:predicted flap endonuclease-1-like 5' DNA nuclease
MAISKSERARMQKVRSIGPKVIDNLESIGIRRMADLRDLKPEEIAFRINCELGKRRINKTGVAALAGLVVAARAEGV